MTAPASPASPTSPSACRCTVLASGAAGKVVTCSACGTVQVALPQVSLRLAPAAFRDLAYLLATAQLVLEGTLDPRPPATARHAALH